MKTVKRKNYDVIHPETSGLLGTVCFHGGLGGWLFMSCVSSHGNGRKARRSPAAAVPPWAKKMGAELRPY